MIKSVFVCYCDWCGEEIKAGRKSLDVDGDITFHMIFVQNVLID